MSAGAVNRFRFWHGPDPTAKRYCPTQSTAGLSGEDRERSIRPMKFQARNVLKVINEPMDKFEVVTPNDAGAEWPHDACGGPNHRSDP
jgi:hypothetical protein